VKPGKRAREWAQLRALCHSGLDPVTLAQDAFTHLHTLLPNAASALFLTTPQGIPQRFFHEDSPDAVRTLFQNEFHLFSGPNEINVVQIVGHPNDHRPGRLLRPPSNYYRSNTYQMLVRASGHHHALDVRLSHRHGTAGGASGAGAIMLFREEGTAFNASELDDLVHLGRLFEHNLSVDPMACEPWQHGETQDALVVAHTSGKVAWLSDEAARLMAQIPLSGQAWRHSMHLPPVLMALVRALQSPSLATQPRTHLAIPGGWLHAHAQWLNPPLPEQDNTGALVGLMLRRVVPRQLRYWRALTQAPLSPRQFEVAFALATGGSLQAVRSQLDISDAVLKDCVRAVYQHFSVNSPSALAEHLAQAAT
jgi:hypothetical protein